MKAGDPKAETPETPEVTVVVPTLGRSPWLGACLSALRRQGGAEDLEILVIDQGPRPAALPEGLADRVLRPERNLGFTGGTNLGIAAARGALVATVNDDAIVAPGWLAALTAALRADPGAAAAQGINLRLAAPGIAPADRARRDPEDTGIRPPAGTAGARIDGGGPEGRPPAREAEPRIDGCGLGWNSWWQAIQLGHDAPAPPVPQASAAEAAGGPPEVREVFGVSATAALYRRSALQAAAAGGAAFDPRLVSYYEDAELAGRLRAAGFRALLVPAAWAWHAGAASAGPSSRDRWRLIYGNRHLAAARLLGRGLWPRLPRMVLRDVLDLLRLLRPAAGAGAPDGEAARAAGETAGGAGHAQATAAETGAAARRARAAGIFQGWFRALRLLPAYAHLGAPALPPAEVHRLSRPPLGAAATPAGGKGEGWLGAAVTPAGENGGGGLGAAATPAGGNGESGGGGGGAPHPRPPDPG